MRKDLEDCEGELFRAIRGKSMQAEGITGLHAFKSILILIPYGTIIALCIWNSLLIFKTHEAIVISLIRKSLSHTLSPLVITSPIIAPTLQMWPLRQ